jgi:hypothetical protein
MNPRVSVVMSVHNGAEYLKAAIHSILTQSYEDFEFIIVNDGSTDGSGQMLAAIRDPRVVSLCNSENIGLGRSLNRGISVARGEYVARMDADDVSYPDRLARQVSFMEGNPDIAYCGGSAVLFHDDNEIDFSKIGHPMVQDRALFRIELLFGPGVVHPTVMFRKELFLARGMQYSDLPYAQDYELWSRLVFELQGINMPDTLLFYRVHGKNAGSRVPNPGKLMMERIWKPFFLRLGLEASQEELEMHSHLCDLRIKPEWEMAKSVVAWAEKIEDNNQARPFFEPALLASRLGNTVFAFLQYSTHFGFRVVRLFLKSRLARESSIPFTEWVKFTLKCFLRYERKSSRILG